MALDLSALENYVKDNADTLVTRAALTSRTIDLISREGTVQTGIKTAERLAMLDTTATFQDGDVCGWSPADTTTISQRMIEVGAIKVEEEICLKVLEKKFTQLALAAGSAPEKLPPPFEQAYTEEKANKIEEQLEQAVWKGDTASGNANLNKFDGFIKLADAATGVASANATLRTGTITTATNSTAVTGVGTTFTTQTAVGNKIYSGTTLIGTVASITNNTAIVLTANAAAAVSAAGYSTTTSDNQTVATSVNATNILDVVDAVVMALPQRVMDSTETKYIFMGTDLVRMYMLALRKANLFHFTTEGKYEQDGFDVPGFNVRVFPTPGLSGTNRIFAGLARNLWYGTDLMNEEENFEMWYERKEQALCFRAEWKSGVQIGLPSELVQFRVAA